MVRFQNFLLASAVSLPSFAYNVKVVGCDDRLRDAGEDFITRMLEDSKLIAGAAVRSTLFGGDPPEESPDENKKLEPLVPDLFGSLSGSDWSKVNDVLKAARTLANEEDVPNKPTIVVSCKTTNTAICKGRTIMETDDPNDDKTSCGQYGPKSCIFLCDEFWNRVLDSTAPNFNRFLPDVSDGVCAMKPITLGSSFSGRIFYHETIHALALGHPPLVNGYSFKDSGYLVDEDAKQTYPTRNMMVEDTYLSRQNPDTYSFWAIMAWRQQKCKWKSVWPFQTTVKGKREDFLAKFPITTIKVDPDSRKKAGVYGIPQYCPGQRADDGFPKDLTKPTMDVVKNTDGSKQDLLWCKFTNQESPDTDCKGAWKWGALTVMGDGGGDVSLLGCFQSVSLGVQEELGKFTAIEEIQQEL